MGHNVTLSYGWFDTMRRLCIAFTIAFSSLWGDPLQQGELLFNSGLYQEAAVQYEKALQDLSSKEQQPLLRYKLAYSHFLAGNPEAVISILDHDKTTQSQYLCAQAYQQLHQHEKAIALFQKCDATIPFTQLQWQLAKSYYHLKAFGLSREAIQKIQESEVANPKLLTASRLFEARLNIAEKKYKEAEKVLASLTLEDSLWKMEAAYLQAIIHYKLENYEAAVAVLDKSIPSRAYSLLGWSALKSAEQSPLQKSFLDKAEMAFTRLNELSKDEESYLTLAYYYIQRAKILNDQDSLEKANLFLADDHFSAPEMQKKALLFKAEMASSYEERDRLYRKLTLTHPHYAQGWFFRGLNDLEEGQKDNAIAMFQKAFDLSKNNDKAQAVQALKYQAQAYLLQRGHQESLAALQILDLISDIPEDKDQILYLRGLSSLQLGDDDSFLEAAIQNFTTQTEQYPDGKHTDDALHLLGILAFRQDNFQDAKEYFLKLRENFPRSALNPDALFWLSQCCEKLKENKGTILGYKKELYEKYPESKYAPEAYFTAYSYFDYINGYPQALEHLTSMESYFPQSPYLLNAYYLIGMEYKKNRESKDSRLRRQKNFKAAIDSFQKVESYFDRFLENKQIDEEQKLYYIYLRYRATIERALANLNIAEESKGTKRKIYLEYAIDLFRTIIQDFDDPVHHPLTQYLVKEEPYPRIKEESEYALALTYLKDDKEDEANAIFNSMLEKYESAKITRGYFLSRVHYEKGMLALKKEQFEKAAELFAKAEDAGKGRVLSPEQKLDLWIQESQCYKAMNQLDKAMSILSKVINEDAVSGLRLKAMVLRAEIYEQQGRLELARKQLESTSKKGGIWAQKAKEKLEKEYGYQ